MKKFSDIITVAAFFTILIMFAVSTLFFQKTVSFSQTKEREGNVKEAASEYVDRNFPMNKNWRSLYTNVMVFTGRSRFGDTYYTNGRLIKHLGRKHKDNTIENVAYVNEMAANTDSQIFMMLAPTAAGVYSADLPDFLSEKSQRETINDAYMQLDKRIASIDAFYPLYSARDEYVFYRTENLWTSFGAYYAYTESTRQLGLQTVTLENYDQEYAASDFYGSLYDTAMVGGIKSDRINIFRSKYQSPVKKVEMFNGDETKEAESVYFRSALKNNKKTDIFLLGDRYVKTDIYTDIENAPKLLIIKGSFANTIVPFYTAHYSKITMVDPKKLSESGLTLSETVDLDEYDQILVLFDIDSFSQAGYFKSLT
ncbi:DHHW family protein [uncultured Ruminococcus sp.]|uniref:DHHW family protein n=1 Tax=uncultured Ruminococcus sp. TaxID=165186 RepID=UPI0025D9A2B4|nr:DHHW family protein [uncultured Ruminococcus sp.]